MTELTVELSPNATKVLERRYYRRNQTSEIIEDWEALCWRVAKTVASAESPADVDHWASIFFKMIYDRVFLPNSPTLMNADTALGQLSGCFVLEVPDKLTGEQSIFRTIEHAAAIHASGGGVGYTFDLLRPNGSIVSTTAGVASGPVSFMRVFDAATEEVKQGGRRRGANMGVLRVDHPDILEFISCKRTGGITNFNISVAVTDEFMQQVEGGGEYQLYHPYTGNGTKLDAREVFNTIVESAHDSGDPGLLFIDKINAANPTPELGPIRATNPCGEQPLLPYEACNLGSINLSKFVVTGLHGSSPRAFDWEPLRQTVRHAVRFLDDVIDVNKYPIPRVEELTKGNRKIGLGVMGLADAFIMLGVPYDADDALVLAEDIARTINETAFEASVELAKERGPFPNINKSIYADQDVALAPKAIRPVKIPIRNATRTTVAPTGSLSMIADCSPSIEPLHYVAWEKHVMDDDRLYYVHPLLEAKLREYDVYSEELVAKIGKLGTLRNIEEIPIELRALFVTAHGMIPEAHVKMQVAFQRHVDSSVSKTVNLSEDASVEDARTVYTTAWRLGCKGVTIYRDKSKETQVYHSGTSASLSPPRKRARPVFLKGSTTEIETGCGPLYITINEDELGPFELFNSMGKAGGCVASQTEAIGRLVSLAWRCGVPKEDVVKQLRGIRCHKPCGLGEGRVLSCADATARAVGEYFGMLDTLPLALPRPERPITFAPGACPQCGGALATSGQCEYCVHGACGWSTCE